MLRLENVSKVYRTEHVETHALCERSKPHNRLDDVTEIVDVVVV